MARRTFIAILLIIACCLSLDNAFARSNPYQDQPCSAAPQSPFRYIIIRHGVSEGTSYPDEKQIRFRGVDVLLDAKSFSEATLKQLFELISKRFPEPVDLRVSVYTNLVNVPTPEEAEYILPSCIGIDFPVPEALYLRNIDFEEFDYWAKELGSPMKIVKLRGKKNNEKE